MYAVSIIETSGSVIDARSDGNASCKVGFVHAYLGLGILLLSSLFATATAADVVEMNVAREK